MSHKKKYLSDYEVAGFLIPEVVLTIELSDHATKVNSKLRVERVDYKKETLVLNGENLILKSVKLNDRILPASEYRVSKVGLELLNLPNEFVLECETEIDPKNNFSLEGLYKSDAIFCTQMEPEGFRKMTYFLDRPDILSKFTTTVIGEKKDYPILLSNGNLIDRGDLEDGKHFTKWEDPFPKPCYLFALVAGDLGKVEGKFKTTSQREIQLEIYVDKGNENRAHHALQSLQKAMKWDEDVFGREYDLDLYMIVAVDAFNFGAMENKGLNIFNSSAVLADERSATDEDFQRIEGIVAHEYFHNWTGNRITLRDWFQLTLKEGLTVFRDQNFSADMHSKEVFRLKDVTTLRERQFVEDCSPMAHPIRPESYIEINNFYTATVYEKGAEVIRMVHTMLGEKLFRKGMDLYFERYDGKAITTRDFLSVMQNVAEIDLEQFELSWYTQEGTPFVESSWDYDDISEIFSLRLSQELPKTNQRPFHIPIKFGWVTKDGTPQAILDEKGNDLGNETILHLKEMKREFKFKKVQAGSLPSLLRNFSAPVNFNGNYSDDQLMQLIKYDSDAFNRYEALQSLFVEEVLTLNHSKQKHTVNPCLLEAYGYVLKDDSISPSFQAQMLALPSLIYLLEQGQEYCPDKMYESRKVLLKSIVGKYRDTFMTIYQKLPWLNSLDSKSMGVRALKNLCLSFLSEIEEEEMLNLLKQHYDKTNNMTYKLGAMNLLCHHMCSQRIEVLKDFENNWKTDPVVMNKWFLAQSSSELDNTLDVVKSLVAHPAFDKKNPNKVRALFAGFAKNLVPFHNNNGSGYSFIADQVIEIDTYNPYIASALANMFQVYPRLDDARKSILGVELKRILDTNKLSKDSFEVVDKIFNH